MRVHRESLFNASIILLCVGVSLSLISLSMLYNPHLYPQDRVYFHIGLKSGSPDAYGNQIRNVTVYQDMGGSWTNRGNLTYVTYDANDDIVGLIDQPVRFDVWVFLNYTFSGDQEDAIAETALYVTITGEFTRQEAEYIEISLMGTEYWILLYRYEWDSPDTAKTYDVRFEYYVSDVSGLENAQDLDEQNPTQEHFWNTPALAEHLFITLGLTYQEAVLYVDSWGGVWGEKGTSKTGWFDVAGFKPLCGIDAFTIDVWVIPSDNTSTMVLAGQREDTNDYAFIYMVNEEFRFSVGDGVTGVTVTSSIHANEFTLYHIIASWDKDNNSGKPVIWVNGTHTVCASGVTNNLDPDVNFKIGARTGPTNYFHGFFAHLNMYDRRMDNAEALNVFQSGIIGYIHDSSNLNNSWSFDEYYSGLYGLTEQTLHDGLGVYTESEQWDIDFLSQSLSTFLFHWWGDYPNEYLWLLCVTGFIVAPCLMVVVAKNDWNIPKRMYFVTLLFILWLCCFALMYGLTPTP